jgi:hypothetical protein
VLLSGNLANCHIRNDVLIDTELSRGACQHHMRHVPGSCSTGWPEQLPECRTALTREIAFAIADLESRRRNGVAALLGGRDPLATI